jgi:hypothetical protein
VRIFGRSFPLQSRVSKTSYPPTKIISAAGIQSPSKNNISVLTNGSTLVNGTVVTASDSGATIAGTLEIVVIAERLASGTFSSAASVSGRGITWTKIGGSTQLTIPWWGISVGNSGTVQITSSDVTWESVEWTLLGIKGGIGIVQATSSTVDNATSISATLSSFASDNNTTLAMVIAGVSADITPESGWDKADLITVTEGGVVTTLLVAETDQVDTSPSASVLSASPMAMWAVEIKAATPKIQQRFFHSSIGSDEAFGTALLYMVDRILPAGIPSAETFGAPLVVYNARLFPTGISSEETFGSVIYEDITASLLTASGSATDGNSYLTASISPSANKLILAWVVNRRPTGNPTTPTLSGCGLTWVQVTTLIFANIGTSTRRFTLFRAMGESPTTDQVTINLITTHEHCLWSISEYDGVDTSGTNGSGAIVQSATNRSDSLQALTVSLSAFERNDNGSAAAFCGRGTITGWAPEAGWDELSDVSITDADEGNTVTTLQTQWIENADNSVTATANGTDAVAGIAVELRAKVGSSVGQINQAVTANSISSDEAFGTAIVSQRVFASGLKTVTEEDIPTILGSGNNGNPQSLYTFSVGQTPDADTLTLLLVRNVKSTGPSLPSPSGLGITWGQEESMSFASIAAPQIRLTLFRAVSSNPTSGSLNIDFGGSVQDNCSYILVKVPGVKVTGANGSDGIPQSETNRADSTSSPLAVTLNSFSSNTNGVMVFFSSGTAVGDITPESGWSELIELAVGSSDAERLALHWRVDKDTTATGTFDAATSQGAIAIELSYLGKGFGVPLVKEQGRDLIFPPGIVSGETFGTATIDGGVVGVGRGHIIDGATFACYRLNNDLNDASPNARHLSLFAGTAIDTDPIIFDKGRARYFDGSTQYNRSGDSNWNTLWLGEWTVELWLVLGDTNTTTRSLLSYYVPSSEAQADNTLVSLSLVYSSGDYKASVLWENGGGNDVSYTTTTNVIASAKAHRRTHIAWRKRSVGGGNYVVDFFSNGTPLETSSSLANADGGGNSNLYVGGETPLFFGRLDDIRISNVARTPAQVFESYRRGLGGAPRTIIVVGG